MRVWVLVSFFLKNLAAIDVHELLVAELTTFFDHLLLAFLKTALLAPEEMLFFFLKYFDRSVSFHFVASRLRDRAEPRLKCAFLFVLLHISLLLFFLPLFQFFLVLFLVALHPLSNF